MNRETIKEIMSSEGILPQSRFGQNFLCDENIINSIVSLCEIKREDHVIEIGPGLGSITFPISELTDNFTCYEIDHGLAGYLKANVKNAGIVDADFLKVISDDADTVDVVVSNIPYYVMTDIMKKLFGEYSNARKMVFMVEEEAIARIDCSPKTKQYGPLSILGSLYGDYRYELTVPHTAFVPQPNTTSAVISFTRKDSADVLCPEFVKFLNSCFSQRRKMLRKNISSYASSDEISKAFESLGISENARAEELPPDMFAALFKSIPK